jgi:acyl-CoA dehydrogenase
LVNYSEINELHVTGAWETLHGEAAVEGLVAIPYTTQSPYARLYQFIKIYLYAASSGLYGCPLSMTDGAVALMCLIGVYTNLIM